MRTCCSLKRILNACPAQRNISSMNIKRWEYEKIGKISLVLFLAAVVLAFLRPLYQSFLPDFQPFYAFLLAGFVSFFLRDENKKSLMTWDFAVKNINWGLMILFSGGLAAGKLIISTGAADSIAQVVASTNPEGVLRGNIDNSAYRYVSFQFVLQYCGGGRTDAHSNKHRRRLSARPAAVYLHCGGRVQLRVSASYVHTCHPCRIRARR